MRTVVAGLQPINIAEYRERYARFEHARATCVPEVMKPALNLVFAASQASFQRPMGFVANRPLADPLPAVPGTARVRQRVSPDISAFWNAGRRTQLFRRFLILLRR